MIIAANNVRKSLLLCTLFAAVSASATENGTPTTSLGVYDFSAGFMPPATPNGTVAFRSSYYTADSTRDDDNKSVYPQFDLTVASFSGTYVKMTGEKILGATYGYGLIVPFLKMDLDFQVDTPIGRLSLGDNVFELADIQFVPLILQWHLSPGLAMNAQFSILAPTGTYDKNEVLGTGVNHWTFSPIYNFTYINEDGFEISSSFELDINARNQDTDYKSGIEYRHEFAVGQHAGSWTLGAGGYIYRQLTDDSAPGLTDGNKVKSTAIGPSLAYFNGASPVVFFHAYKEFGAENRTQGYTAALRIGYSF
jgi:hypothetical protein